MTPQEFVNGIHSSVIDENVSLYRGLFNDTTRGTVTDPYWQRALALFDALTDEQREVFFEVVRQVAVDTASNLLGVLDGVSSMRGLTSRLTLLSGPQEISGDLQSMFLADEERKASERLSP